MTITFLATARTKHLEIRQITALAFPYKLTSHKHIIFVMKFHYFSLLPRPPTTRMKTSMNGKSALIPNVLIPLRTGLRMKHYLNASSLESKLKM